MRLKNLGKLARTLDMGIAKKVKRKLSGLASFILLRQWMSTLDYQALHYDPAVDPASSEFAGPAIFIFWHEYIPFPVYLRPHCNLAMLVSRHRDAEWLSQAARYMGFDTVRGSTKRGGDAALRELLRKSKNMNLAITPDGPRGPRRRLASGCIYVASRLSIPLIPMGFAYDRPWRLSTWDRFAVPRPYSRARAVVGPSLQVPNQLDRDGIEHYRCEVESTLNFLSDQAEVWAESGERRRGQIPVSVKAAPLDRLIDARDGRLGECPISVDRPSRDSIQLHHPAA